MYYSIYIVWCTINRQENFFPESFGKPRLWVDALSQNAFDTGAGMGLMIPYSSYMTNKNGIVKYGHLIPATNNLIR